ncbi:MAG: flagellar hook-basal body complex protein [Candidatus Eremiobacteraeota bacterium]|nr:flagellar hook-basal body complex protein [Candidatus Eremiobacteraeota bacterium]MBV9056954.1 flagellar hook-basal body complex protein [Candidatus Eremiobacteraeota bacterium]MBV9700389.1 flagellar hook-basal body complex protein [Candidatus Eremiobacteraeota bacterium]
MDGIAWAASAMVAARTRLEIATDNLANCSTDGFRRVVARGVLTAHGVSIARATAADYGALRQTGRDLDLAISGDGAFRVRDAAGRIEETRSGAFVRMAEGTLRDAAGRTLLGVHGPLKVSPGGRVDAAALGLPERSRVRRGFLETSGVDAIAQMIDVLCAERSFESAQKAVAAIDSSRQKSAEAARVK